MRGWADSSSRTLREKTDWFEYITLSRHGPCGPNVEQGRSPLSRNCADKSFVFEGAVSCVFWRWPAGQLWIPLGKGGVDAPSRNIPVPLKGADGVVRSNSTTISFERTTPSAPVKVASRNFLNGRSHPSFPKFSQGGEFASNLLRQQSNAYPYLSLPLPALSCSIRCFQRPARVSARPHCGF